MNINKNNKMNSVQISHIQWYELLKDLNIKSLEELSELNPTNALVDSAFAQACEEDNKHLAYLLLSTHPAKDYVEYGLILAGNRGDSDLFKACLKEKQNVINDKADILRWSIMKAMKGEK